MDTENKLLHGSITRGLLTFALPYLLSSFMQTFYGMADLIIVGLYEGAKTTSAVSIGSQFMHMVTVVIVGFAMGTTVHIGQSIGAQKKEEVNKSIGTTILLFGGFSIVLALGLYFCAGFITNIMQTPVEAVTETIQYLKICFIGIPLIVAYNIIASIFRGLGDSKRPMYFVAIACVVNIILDFAFIGYFHMSAIGAALGTILGQGVSVLISLIMMKKLDLGISISKEDIHLNQRIAKRILSIGTPVACQDGFIQISFLLITMIANSRGLIASSSVGIVEKIISFFFLVPSAFLSSISTMTAQNIGAGQIERAKKALFTGMKIALVWGAFIAVYCQFFPRTVVGLFTKDTEVISAGCDYLRSYVFDTFFASIHFCFSGYFCGTNKSVLSFIHNVISVVLIRVPGAYFASLWFPQSLYPMGWAPALGSVLSSLICFGFYWYYSKKKDIL